MNLLNYSVGNWGFFLYFFFCITGALCQLQTTYWVSEWTENSFEEQQKTIYPTVFGILIILYVVLTFSRSLVIFLILTTSTTNMHKKMVESIIRSKIIFFDSNPIGRIFTRFSKDIAVLDLILPPVIGLATFTVFRTISVFITVIVVFPSMLIVVAFALLIMLFIVRRGSGPMRECLRMDSIFRGPINSQFAMIVNGLVSLRTYERIPYFR
jgi:ABC-type multidrug transport system fused ATPase/permease subunit